MSTTTRTPAARPTTRAAIDERRREAAYVRELADFNDGGEGYVLRLTQGGPSALPTTTHPTPRT